MKSRKLKNYQILANFPKRAFYHLVYVMNRFSRDCLLDTNQISKELYRSVLLHENFQCFQCLPAVEKSIKLYICSFSGRSIPNLKSTRTPEQIEQLSFGAIGAKIPL